MEKTWQLSKWLLKQSVINIHSSLQNNFLVRHWPAALVGGEGKNLSADGFYFPYWHYCVAHFQFSSRGAKTCLQSVWSSKHLCLCLKYHPGLLHICSTSPPSPPPWCDNGLLLLYARVKLIFMTTFSLQFNVLVSFYPLKYTVRARKWVIAQSSKVTFEGKLF